MYVILVYDVEERRVTKICKYLRQYLHWIQNSVFEGELTEGKLKEMQTGLMKKINVQKDSVIIFKMNASYNMEKDIIGTEKSPVGSFV